MGRIVSAADLARGVRAGDRSALARAITLAESHHRDHRAEAIDLIERLMPFAGASRRVGITGVPGVGKSTLIDQLGCDLVAAGHRLAILAVDPSSSRSGGSILGDKTRMARLAADPRAFIRPSPAAGTLGGVALRTREAILICEAAGFDVVLVETVGVGQSETAVAGMVDCFVVLALPGAGDELQGIKKGVLELADIIAVNKADGDNEARALRAAADMRAALDVVMPAATDWRPPILTVSALQNTGIEALWRAIEQHRQAALRSGAWAARREHQSVDWLHELLRQRLFDEATGGGTVADVIAAAEAAVRNGTASVPGAVEAILGRLAERKA